MDNVTISLIIVGVYLLISLIMGIWPALKVSSSVGGFVAGDRSMNTFLMYFVLGGSIFSSFAFLGGPGWAYSRGAAAFFIIAYALLGIVPLYFFGGKAWHLGKKYGFVTQAELLSARYDSRFLSILLSFLSVVVLIPYLTLQMKGAGYVLNVISDGSIPEWVGAGVTYLVVLVYVYFSGVMGVGWSNAFQGLYMMILAWVLGIYLPNKLYGGVGEMFTQILNSDKAEMLTMPGLDASGMKWSWGLFSSTVLVSAVGYSVWPHFFMRSFAAKSAKVFQKSVMLYPSFLLMMIPILLIGFAAILKFPGVTPADSILPYLLMQLDLPAVVIGLFCAGALAASMSSGDAILHTAASVAIRDGIAQIVKTPLSDAKERSFIRVAVLIIGFVAYYFAVVSKTSIVGLLVGAYGGVAQIFPIIFAAFYWKKASRIAAICALTGGIVTNTFFLILPELKPFALHEGVYGLFVNIVLLVSLSLWFPNKH